VPTLDHTLEPKPNSVRRLEVITGTGRRRRFSEDDKARIIEETVAPGVIISDIARRHGRKRGFDPTFNFFCGPAIV
jgi:transposase